MYAQQDFGEEIDCFQVCQHVVATEDDDDVPLQCLCDLATSVPKTLQPHLNDIFTLCASVCFSLLLVV